MVFIQEILSEDRSKTYTYHENINRSLKPESIIIFSNMEHDCVILLELVLTTISNAINIFVTEVTVNFNNVDIDLIIF